MESYSLYQLNEYLRRVIALNFNDPIWIHAEILQISESRGNHYIELIEKKTDGTEVIAQSTAVIWYKSFLFLKSKLKNNLGSLLRSGIEIKLKVKLDFNERYGFKLVIEDIDPSFTLGKMEMQKQELVERLEREGLIEKNGLYPLPTICQSIAVISSKTAAGYQDFLQQLSENSYGYFYRLELFDAAMQGQNTSRDVTKAINAIEQRKDEFDCAIIIRGGGSKLDLGSFDDYEICKAIAHLTIPLLTGIGHDIDNGLADLVSHSNLKTPTAVADFFIERALHFDSTIIQLLQEIKEESISLIEYERTFLSAKENQINNGFNNLLNQQSTKIKHQSDRLTMMLSNILNTQQSKLSTIQQVLNLSDPKLILKKGYTLIKQGNQIITTKKSLKKKDEITIVFSDGEINTHL